MLDVVPPRTWYVNMSGRIVVPTSVSLSTFWFGIYEYWRSSYALPGSVVRAADLEERFGLDQVILGDGDRELHAAMDVVLVLNNLFLYERVEPPDPVRQELRDREAFMRSWAAPGPSGVMDTVWAHYESYKAAIAEDKRPDVRCCSCGRHRNQVGDLISRFRGVWMCRECDSQRLS